jgi:BON domain-containing protein
LPIGDANRQSGRLDGTEGVSKIAISGGQLASALQRRLVVLSRAVLIVALAASACSPTITATVNDAALTAAIKTALLNNPDVDGTLIDVRCEGGVAHLEGSQPSPEAVAKVMSIVRGVDGVRDVQSAVTVADGRATEPLRGR